MSASFVESIDLHFLISFKLVSDDMYIAETTVCEVEKHIWVGWKVDELMQDGRVGYITRYFSQGGKWTNIQESKFSSSFKFFNIHSNW